MLNIEAYIAGCGLEHGLLHLIEVYKAARAQFSEEELVNLTLAITTINAWNRLSIAFRAVPGTYQPQVRKAG
jgi:alkylhydroperoxidase family enzyme